MALFAPGSFQGINQGLDDIDLRAKRKQDLLGEKQQYDQNQFLNEKARADQARDLQGQQASGSWLDKAFPQTQQPPPITQGGAPGQSSAPPPMPQNMQPPPMSPNGQMGGMQPPPMGMAPPPMGMPQGQPMGGMAPPPMGMPQGQPMGGMAPPPPPPLQPYKTVTQGQTQSAPQMPSTPPVNDMGTQGISVNSLIQSLRQQGISQDRWPKILKDNEYLFDAQSKQQLAEMRIQQQASAAGEKAYRDENTRLRDEATDKRQSKYQDSMVSIAGQRANTGDRNADTNAKREMDQLQLGTARISAAKAKAAAGLAPKDTELDDPDVARVWYDIFKNTGKAPPFAFGQAGNPTRNKWTQIVASLAKEDGGGGTGIAQSLGDYKANVSANTAITKREAGIDYSISKLKNDMGTMNSVLDKVAAKGGASIINKPLNALRGALSDPDFGVLDLTTKQVGMEYERQLNGGQLSAAQLHAGAAEDAKKLVNGNMTIAEIRAKLPIMTREMDNASIAAKDVKQSLRLDNKSQNQTKTIGGVTYHNVNGQWMQ